MVFCLQELHFDLEQPLVPVLSQFKFSSGSGEILDRTLIFLRLNRTELVEDFGQFRQMCLNQLLDDLLGVLFGGRGCRAIRLRSIVAPRRSTWSSARVELAVLQTVVVAAKDS